MLGCRWVASHVVPSLTMCRFVEAPSVVSVVGVLASHVWDSSASIKKERNKKPWRVPWFLLWLSAVPSCRSTGTEGHWGVSAVPGSSCWGAWGTASTLGTPHFVDSTIKCYGILICYLLIFHFLHFWHSDPILMKRLPQDMNAFLELKVGLAKHFPRMSSFTPGPFPREGVGSLWGLWLEMCT